MMMMRRLLFASVVAISAWAQNPAERLPRFEDYPIAAVFKGKPALPVLETPEELKFKAVIGDGVSKGWGVFDGITGKELQGPRPNFAGHYTLVSFGCAELALTGCFGAATVDVKTGRVYRAPSPTADSGFKLPYFGVFAERPERYPLFSFHNIQIVSPLEYRLDSRMLIARICERVILEGSSLVGPKAIGCGAHYYLMGDDGLKLIQRAVE